MSNNDPGDDYINMDSHKPKAATTWRLYAALIIVLLGPFVFGYSVSVVNELLKHILVSLDYPLGPSQTTAIVAIAVSSFHVGGICDAFIIGFFADSVPRIILMAIFSVFVIFGSLLTSFSNSLALFAIARFLVGMASAGFMMVVPVYINEISPDAKRGFFGVLVQMSIVVGIFVGFLVNVKGSSSYWPLLVGMPALVGFLVLLSIGAGGVPQSPKYLLPRGRGVEAMAVLVKLYGDEESAKCAIDEFKMGHANEEQKPESKLAAAKSLFSEKVNLVAISIAIFLQITQQFSGISVIIQYSGGIIEKIGPQYVWGGNLGLSVVNIFFTIAAIFLVEKVGRKIILLTSTVGMAVFYAIATIVNLVNLSNQTVRLALTLVSLYGFIAMFAIGMGPVPWMIVSEMFPTKLKGVANSVSTFVNFLFAFIATYLGPYLVYNLGNYVFLPFCGYLLVVIPIMALTVVETKGKSIEEVQEDIGFDFGLQFHTISSMSTFVCSKKYR